MTTRPPHPIRHCPLCGIAMQASKSRPGETDFDTFRCLTCNTTINEQPKVATVATTVSARRG